MCKGLATLPATCLKSAKDIKHKISFLLQKPEPQTSDQKQMKEKSSAAASAVKRSINPPPLLPPPPPPPPLIVLVSHVVNSDETSASSSSAVSAGRSVFTSFLRSEFSQENMDFWVACEDYKKTPASKLPTRAKQIYQQFIEADAPQEVNLDAATRDVTRQNVENPCPACFDEAQRMIYLLMEKDSYRRFLSSKLIQDLSQTHSNTNAAAKKEIKSSNCTGGA
ncbi:hypothetical protein INR49_010430 [Caranx melampygus]|nr:hypothetical protein INR49_010430 [Caranx melampygus]